MSSPGLQQRLLSHLQELSRPRHAQWPPLGLISVRNYVQEQLAALGNVEQHRFQDAGGAGVNLILRLPGQDSSLPPLLLGAHYDGPLHSIGADDNASGVAALLELACRWRRVPPRRPVWIVAFDLEEWGMLGSAALARELRAARQPLKLMVCLEMLAYTAEQQHYPLETMRTVYGNSGDYIALVANTGSAPLLPGLSRRMGAHVKTKVLPVPIKGRQLPDVSLSDHSSFWDQGYDALMVTDTSFMRNPNYHCMTDTIETLDLPFFSSVVNGLDAALAVL